MQFTTLGQAVFDGSEIPNQATSALTPGATVAVNIGAQGLVTLTPAQSCTLNASGGTNNQILIMLVTTSGTTSYTLTFGTNFKSQGTLATGTVSGKVYTLKFTNINGTWHELSRSSAM